MRRLAVLGASGHGKVVADLALAAGWQEVVFVDDRWPELRMIGPWEVIGVAADLPSLTSKFDKAIIAIGNNDARMRHLRQLMVNGVEICSLTHPSAIISPYAKLRPGSVVCAVGVVGAFASIGAGAIVNTGATVDHDCVLADGVHVSPGAHLGGAVTVGEGAWIGIGASVKHGVTIGSHVVVGAGAAVVSDVADGTTVVGVPARPASQVTLPE